MKTSLSTRNSALIWISPLTFCSALAMSCLMACQAKPTKAQNSLGQDSTRAASKTTSTGSTTGSTTENTTVNTTGSATGSDGKQAEANLTQVEAAARQKLLSDIRYSLNLNISLDSDQFDSNAKIDFKMASAQTTFLDLDNGAIIHRMSINGQSILHPDLNNHRLTLPAQSLRAGANEVEVDYTQNFSHDGRGLHRFKDPEDKKVYLYSQFESYDAHQMFPCFDQPDLKANMTLTASVPKGWEAISTTRESSRTDVGETTNWVFPQTPKLSTYLFSFHAGPYHKWESRAGDIPLRLFARESLAKFIVVKDWFKPTQEGLKFYGEYFALPYPFKKYDQIITPDFNAGAMENVAAVTFTENFVHRGSITRQDRESLASVILHEMAHMWFGDLVTMQWWDGLWLNESFATFMSALAVDQATEYKESWQSFNRSDKAWAYFEDQLVTTHPINGEVVDTDSTFNNFDGITYGKGASVLKQLSFYLGADVFRDGVRYYFKTHAYGNTRLNDFIGALEHASGKDLSGWSQAWLQESGLDTVAADFDCKSGKISRFELKMTGPDGVPSTGSQGRSHRTLLALYDKNSSQMKPAQTVDVIYKGASTPVPEVIGTACPVMVDPNDQDQDYVKVRLDSRTLENVRAHLSDIKSPFTRVLFWANLFQMVRDAQLSPREYLKTVSANFPKEKDVIVGDEATSHLSKVIYYLPNYASGGAQNLIHDAEDMLWIKLRAATPGSDWQKRGLKQFTDVVQTSFGRDHLANLLSGKEKLRGLDLDTDRRWSLIERLAALGDPRAKDTLAAEKKKDGSERGLEQALTAEASWPDGDMKRQIFDHAAQDSKIPFARSRATLRGVLPTWQDGLRMELAPAYYETLPTLLKTRQDEFLQLFSSAFLPSNCTSESTTNLTRFIDANATTLTPTVKKTLLIGRQENQRCVQIRNEAALHP